MCVTVVLGGEIVLLAVLQTLGITARRDEYILALIVLALLAYMLDVLGSKSLAPVRVCLILGVAFRFALLMLDVYGRDHYQLPNSGVDSEHFYKTALMVADGGKWNLNDLYGGMFSFIMGTVFRLIGGSRLYGQFLVMCFAVTTIHVADKIMRILSIGTRSRRNAMFVLCLLPNFAILSVVFLRESIITMFMSISLLLFVRWWKGAGEWNFVGAFAFVFVAAMFHDGVLGAAAGYILIRFLYDREKGKFRLSWKSVIPSVACVIVFGFLYNNYADVFFGKTGGLESIDEVANIYVEGGSTYGSYVGNSDTLGNMLIYTPIRLVMFQFSPFFWQIRGINDIIAIAFNSLFYLYVWFKAIRYIISKRNKNRALVISLSLIGLVTSFVFAWGVTNTGTAVRHRDKMIVLYAVLFGLLLDGNREEKKAGQTASIVR